MVPELDSYSIKIIIPLRGLKLTILVWVLGDAWRGARMLEGMSSEGIWLLWMILGCLEGSAQVLGRVLTCLDARVLGGCIQA